MTFYLSSHPFQMARRYAMRQHEAERAAHSLAVDIHEESDTYTLTAFVPGLKADSLNIQVLDNTLTIEGTYEKSDAEFVMSELPSGPFRRSLRFPVDLNAENTVAHIENGVLSLQVAKVETAKPKSIQVTVK
jgi:HSP20 family protein